MCKKHNLHFSSEHDVNHHVTRWISKHQVPSFSLLRKIFESIKELNKAVIFCNADTCLVLANLYTNIDQSKWHNNLPRPTVINDIKLTEEQN